MDKDMNINRSSYLTLHLILHLLYDGYIDYRDLQNLERR